MNSQIAVPSVTLQTAVLMQVKEFATNNQKFSVHDITRSIRQKTRDGQLEIPEVEVSGASFRFDIPHSKVKALFDELYRTGVFDPDFSLNRQFTGMYFEYIPTPLNTSSAMPPATVTPSVPTAVVPTVSLSQKSVFSVRISTYLANCKSRNFRPTLKQVQSAIKRGNESTGLSCEEIQTIVVSDLGYKVSANPDYVSATQVIL